MEKKQIENIENRFLTRPMGSNQERVVHLLDYAEGAPLCWTYSGVSLKFYIVYTIRDVKFVNDRKQWDKVITIAYDREEAKRKILNAYKDDVKKIMSIQPFIRHSDNSVMSDRTVKVGFHRKVDGKLVHSHNQTYKLALNETEEMLEYSLKKHYNSYYYITIISDKSTEIDMEASRKTILVKELRVKTSGKLNHCNDIIKKLLDQDASMSNDEVIRQAVIVMNNKKQIVAATKVSRDVNFFVIKYQLAPYGSNGILIKFGCESEQGSKTLKDKFDEILHKITSIAVTTGVEYRADLLLEDFDEDNTVQMKLEEIAGTLGENVQIVNLETIESVPDVSNTFTEVYIHGSTTSDKAAAILIYNIKDQTNKEIVRKMLHQLVYTNPLTLKEHELLDSIVESEREHAKQTILRDNVRFDELTAKKEVNDFTKEEAEELKKLRKTAEKFMGKQVEGKVNNFKKDVCFELQDWMFKEEDEKKKTIKQLNEEKGISLFDFTVV